MYMYWQLLLVLYGDPLQAVGSTTPWMCRQLGNHDQTSTLSPLLRKVHCLISEHFSNRISCFNCYV